MKELLLLLCRYPFEEKNRETLSKLLAEVQDWPAMVKVINSHGIIALAAYNLKEARLEKKIPGDAMALLENAYMQSVARNAWLIERWKEVNTLLCNAGIKHIVLKGMALEHTLYGSRGLRQMSDNDIFIKHDESLKAWQLLQQEGFTIEPLKSPLFKKIMFSLGQHLPTLYKNGFAIEIHHDLFDQVVTNNKRSFDYFEDAVETKICGVNALILSKETQVMYLIDHFERHAMEGDCQLRLFNDIILLDKNSKIEFPDRFISDPKQSHKTEFRKAAYKANLKILPKWQRPLYILGDTFPSAEWMKKRYNCNWMKLLFYYPVRVSKLLWLI
jgi:hypothetical protein